MKKLFYSLVVVALISILTSCTPKPAELILGSWKLDKVEVENLEELAQIQLDFQKGQADEQIASLNEQIEMEENEELKIAIQEQLDAQTAAKEELTLESLLKEANDYYDKIEGEVTFTEDNKVAGDMEGDWAISEDGKTLTAGIEYEIRELNEKTLVIYYEEEKGENVIKTKNTYTKGETTDVTEEHDTEEHDGEETE